MSTLVLELAETVTSELEKGRVSQQEIHQVALAAIELWPAQRVEHIQDDSRQRPFSQGAVPFAPLDLSESRDV